MKVVYNTYPWAYFTPGGGEYQIEKVFDAIKRKKNQIQKFNQWDPQKDADVFHFFSCI